MDENVQSSVSPWIHEVRTPLALLSYLYRTISRRFAKDLSPRNLGWGHFAILMAVYEQEGRSQDSLAQARGFDKTMIAKSVLKLEEDGLIYRQNDPDDKRVKRLYLADPGWALQDEMLQTGQNIYRILLKDFSEKEAAETLEYLRRMALNAAEL